MGSNLFSEMSFNCSRILLNSNRPIQGLAANLKSRAPPPSASVRFETRRPLNLRAPRLGATEQVYRTADNRWQTSKRHLGTQVPRPYVDPKLSYAFGRSNEHLIYSTVSRELARQLRERPDEVAFVSHAEGLRRTIRQLSEDINRLTKALVQRFNIRRGDFVGVFAYNCYNWVLVQFACARIGAILTPINPSYKSHELAFVLRKGKVKCLLMPGPKSIQAELNNHLEVLQANEIIEMSRSRELMLENVILMDSDRDYDFGSIGFKLANCQLHNWSATEQNDGLLFGSQQEAEAAGVSEDQALVLDLDEVSPDDLFAVYYTSGTTGQPKGACVSQFTVVNNVRLCQIRLRNGRQRSWHAKVATTLPMFHIFAGVLNSLSPATSHTTVVYSSHKYDIGTFVESIREHEANITNLTPTMLIDLLTHVEQMGIKDLPLRVVQPGGSPLAPELVTRAFKVLPELEELRSGYGSTENGAVATFQTIHEPNEFRALTVGPPLDFTEIRIVDPNNGDKVLPLGEQGEVQTRGYNTMTEYLDEPEKTREVLTRNRWYRTGDIGLMRPHGSIEISGRLKHMIIKGGENIYPEEVEKMIYRMGCVEKVHVVGVPDERFGEQVCAWIKLKPGFIGTDGDAHLAPAPSDASTAKRVSKAEIVGFCKENITYFKVPKYLLFVDDFPMTPTKKVQGHLMTERSIEVLGLERKSR